MSETKKVSHQLFIYFFLLMELMVTDAETQGGFALPFHS